MAINLLILIADEHRRDAMGCAGHPQVQTPNLDALAKRGTRFTNAYTPSPMCVPARAALATGQMPHKTGYWDSATPYDGRVRSWMTDISAHGIEVASIGKLHFRGTEGYGFTEEILPMHVVGGVGWTIGLLRDPPPAFDATAELAEGVGVGRSSYTDYDRDITAAAEAWLAGKAGGSDPWVCTVSLVSPHYPLTAPEEFAALYDPKDMDLPVGYAPDARPAHPELKALSAFFDYDRHFDLARLRAAKAAYFALTSFMDDCVGRILRALDAAELTDDTVVLFVSDHGEMLGDHGLWTKQVMFEASAGVPMILAGPGVPEAHEVATAVSLVDVADTAREVMGIAAPGPSLVSFAQDADDPERTVLVEYHDGGSTTGGFMVRWDRWKYVEYVGHRPQLFDLKADPQELHDLAESPDTALEARLKDGGQRLRALCDPEAVNARCFADQAARIAALGGVEACRTAYAFGHTPTPKEQTR